MAQTSLRGLWQGHNDLRAARFIIYPGGEQQQKLPLQPLGFIYLYLESD
jgi:hypothetical protein